MREDLKYWIGFNMVPGIGPKRFEALLKHFGSAGEAWQATPADLQAAGLDTRSLQSLLTMRSQLDLDAELERNAKADVTVLTWDDPGYPPLLKQIYDPPYVLYVRGELLPADEWAIAVVGTRRASAYGREAARRLAGDLAMNGVTIVSGLAQGIDSHAHKIALEAGGRTIAVLAHGLDQVYPPQNRSLAAKIVEQGALVSEFALGTRPEAKNFPARNRIISGLSLGTLVVEAGKRSGALITAEFAAEQGREVFAVPGNIFAAGAAGTNQLIQSGAKVALSVEDILEELNLTMLGAFQQAREIVPENEMESRLLEHLSDDPIHIDELGRAAGVPISEVSSTLALMELKGMVRQVGGMNYVVARESRADYHTE
ncbi:MAG: DNA-protecting protein DprA [Chloroflexi bacterium]|nr:MAG: DNA-protecting protein DprA [Chloroflexota bacterium]